MRVRAPGGTSIGAFAIIFDDQRGVLLCHRRDADQWNLPGGGLERARPLGGGDPRSARGDRLTVASSLGVVLA